MTKKLHSALIKGTMLWTVFESALLKEFDESESFIFFYDIGASCQHQKLNKHVLSTVHNYRKTHEVCLLWVLIVACYDKIIVIIN